MPLTFFCLSPLLFSMSPNVIHFLKMSGLELIYCRATKAHPSVWIQSHLFSRATRLGLLQQGVAEVHLFCCRVPSDKGSTFVHRILSLWQVACLMALIYIDFLFLLGNYSGWNLRVCQHIRESFTWCLQDNSFLCCREIPA